MAPKKFIFHRERRRSNPVTILILLFLVLSVLLVNQGYQRREIKPLFEPTPTATRLSNSFVLEARTHFDSGALDKSIQSFQQAIDQEPNNGGLYAEKARVLTYSSQMLTTETDRQKRLEDAVNSAKKGTELSPDDSTVYAVYAFALDWYATFVRDTLLDAEKGKNLLLEADQTISKANSIDQNNLTAQTYYAEIMIDTGRFKQAYQAINGSENSKGLLARAPDSWEVHRINGLYLEFQADYIAAMDEYEKASKLAPNMPFLYIKLGQSKRQYGMRLKEGAEQDKYFNDALNYFDIAANLNEQLGIKDPYPYLGIGYTYAQMGQFLIATRNMERALSFDPSSPKVYGDLGMVARQGKNYEMAVEALQCAVEGCTAEVSCDVRQCNADTDPPIVITGMPLDSVTVSYYFTYAALLSAMYVPNKPDRANYCDTALRVIDKVRSVPKFNNEPIYDSIMKESENICASYGITTFKRK